MVKTVDFSTFSNLRIGPKVDVLVVEEAGPLERFIIGGANNLLIGPTPPPLAMLSKTFDFIRLDNGVLHVGAATPSGKLFSFAKKHDLGGFEFMQQLPGTLGGMLAMNAGLKGWEIFNPLVAVRTHKGWVKKATIKHGYRYAYLPDNVFEATFTCKEGFDRDLAEQFRQMRANQPKDPSAGSCFKNPPNESAGRLLEAVGFRGKQRGGMAFSPQHANFLVNLGGGTYEEAIALIQEAKATVLAETGILLELEIKIINLPAPF
ncbi:UDP-N-acetylmuramate dehydrogenase [Sulfurospirillum sp. T05]|uniref:UDP-N-acetylenolpyruvoylglucosamine reductase n=1 Tax=Sulfurospirillum tamanense TaxID=2813362 RepID=A0ABS2WS50_9BACT|nr:UDP-N-acetylmuramate dehydrogenase [Sulfurospirillum tamanensis]MBN2964446.1 UDP-N-acetylmuramate dehydrogenase [Sulfurospirillum tamanensis]